MTQGDPCASNCLFGNVDAQPHGASQLVAACRRNRRRRAASGLSAATNLARGLLAVLATAAAVLPASPAGAEPPNSDAFADATVAAPLPFTDSVDITDATFETDEGGNCQMAGTVWYQVIVPADGQLRADPSGSSFADVCVTGFRDAGGGLSGLQPICCAAIGT